MRIDKYLKVARIIKRRPIAKQLALNDRLFINDKLAKPSSEVEIGDLVKIIFGHRQVVIRVLQIKENVSKEESFLMYEVIEEKKES